MQHAYLLNRHIQLVVTRILQKQVVAVASVNLNVFHANVTPNTVYGMDNVIAGLNFRKILQLRAFIFAVQTAPLLHAENIAFGN